MADAQVRLKKLEDIWTSFEETASAGSIIVKDEKQAEQYERENEGERIIFEERKDTIRQPYRRNA